MEIWRESRVDEPAAHRLLAEYFEARAAGFPAGTAGYRTTFPVADDFLAPTGAFLVVADAEDTDLACGGIRLLASDGTGRVRFEVKHLYVRPAARRLGLGRALLDALESRAEQFGATELVLDTHSSLTAAATLYRSAGYLEIPPYNDNPNATTWYLKSLR